MLLRDKLHILSRSGAYTWPQPALSTTSYTANGLNQYTNVGGSSYSYDGRGNLSTTPSQTYSYDVYNRLTSFVYGMSLGYDPAGRLYETELWGYHSRFLYDGADMIMEVDGNTGNISGRYVYGPGVDEPIIWYDGATTNDRRFLMTDERGTITATSNPSAVLGYTFAYDEFGQLDPNTAPSRFRFTGQMWLGWGYHYKARAYDQTLGRFLQSDPILYAGGMNLYAYVENDPINFTDPLGLQDLPMPRGPNEDIPELPPIIPGGEIVVPGPNSINGVPVSAQAIANYLTAAQIGGVLGGRTLTDDEGTSVTEYPATEEIIVVCGALACQQEAFRRASNWASDRAIEFYFGDVLPISFELFLAGRTASLAVRGGEIALGRNLRIAPFGNRTGHRLGERPHYHRRITDNATGETRPGGGIGWHRPWEGGW